MIEKTKGYKGFNKDMTCKGKQYEENTTYEENGNGICSAGVMHFCKNPWDVLNYYPIVNKNGEISEFADVESQGELFEQEDKSATTKLHIGAKLGLKGFLKACIDFTLEKTKYEGGDTELSNDNEDDYAKIGSSGDSAKIVSEGKNSVVMAAGYNSIAKAKIGSWITLSEWGGTGEEDERGYRIYIPKCVKTEYVDGERIKEDTFYKLVDGEFVEACE